MRRVSLSRRLLSVVIVATWLSCPCQGRSRSVVIIISFPVFFSPDEALMALAVMHNLAPEELKVTRVLV